jgi:hypothetical protein
MTLDELFAKHDAALTKLTVQQQRRLLQVIRQHRAELLGELASNPVNNVTLQNALIRLNPLFVRLSQRLGEELDAAVVDTHALGTAHAFELWRHRGLGRLPGPPDEFEIRVAARLADYRALRIHTHSTNRYSRRLADRIQGQLTAGAIQGEGETAMVRRIRAQTPLAESEARLVVRMETNLAYNRVASEFVAEAGPGWTRRISEVSDANNHPFSRVADGETARPGRNFRVSVAEVNRQAALMKRSVGTVLWRIVGDHYIGETLPAHYGERGRIVPWSVDS